jgi:hypothetical protein
MISLTATISRPDEIFETDRHGPYRVLNCAVLPQVYSDSANYFRPNVGLVAWAIDITYLFHGGA